MYSYRYTVYLDHTSLEGKFAQNMHTDKRMINITYTLRAEISSSYRENDDSSPLILINIVCVMLCTGLAVGTK